MTRDYVVKQLDVDAKDFHCFGSHSSSAQTTPTNEQREERAATAAVPRRFGADVACRNDKECFEWFSSHDVLGRLWQATSGGVGQSSRLPSDVQCNASTRLCHGLDGALNVYALCSMLLRHLLVNVPSNSEMLMRERHRRQRRPGYDDDSQRNNNSATTAAAAEAAQQFVTRAGKIMTDCTRHSRDKRLSPLQLRHALLRLTPLAATADSVPFNDERIVAHDSSSVEQHAQWLRHFARTTAPPLDIRPSAEFNKLKRAFLRIELPPRANATALSLQVDALKRENNMLRARIRQLERASRRIDSE